MSNQKLKVGDFVKVNYSHPLAPALKFEIKSFQNIAGQEQACGDHGCFHPDLLVKTKRTKKQ